MIFAHTLEKIICGEKWQTRRLIKPDELFESTTRRVVKSGKRTVYEIGKSYAVQPNRGKKSIGRIIIKGIRRELVTSISESDAQAEGFPSREEFIATWQKIHGRNADLSCEVWVLEFEVVAIVANEFKVMYETRSSKYRGSHNGDDISVTVEGVSGVSLHSRNH